MAAIAAAAIAVSSVAASAVEFGEIQEVQPGDSVNATVTQPTLPLSQYPSGSTFSSGYAGASQCMAFAIYVFDQYSHMTSYSTWSVPAADRHVNPSYSSLKTKSDVYKKLIMSLPAGSYVRVTDNPSADGQKEEGYESDIDNTNAYGDSVSEDTEDTDDTENTEDASTDKERVPSVQDDLT